MMKVAFKHAKTMNEILGALERGSLYDGTFVFCDETDRFYIQMHGNFIGITPKRRDVLELKCKSCGLLLLQMVDLQ